MKKTTIVILCLAFVLLNAFSVFAVVSPYLSMQSVNRRPVITRATNCNLDITANTADVRFVGKARQECIEKNKYNTICQQNCFDQVRLLVTGRAGRERGMNSRTRSGCKDADPVLFVDATASQCHHIAANECAMANSMSEYCRRKCNEKAYNLCRQQRARRYGL